MEIKNILNEDFDYESDSWNDGEVEQGKSFFEDGYDWKWMRRVGDVVHLDFDNWAVWMAFRPEDENNIHGRNVVAFFIVDEDTGFIDWGPCETYEEANEFLESKKNDWEMDESLNEDLSYYQDRVEKLLASDLVDTVEEDEFNGQEAFRLISNNGKVLYLVPSTLSQVDVYDESGKELKRLVSWRDIVDEFVDDSEATYICQLVGGKYEGTYTEEEAKALPCFHGEYSRDWSKERAAGGFVNRKELDNKPEFEGYLGPMFGGWADGHKLILRYETQEVYDRLSEKLHSTLHERGLTRAEKHNRNMEKMFAYKKQIDHKMMQFLRDNSDMSEDDIQKAYDDDKLSLVINNLGLKDAFWGTDYKSIKESDEEQPYTKKQVEQDLKSITHNFTDKEGDLKCGFEEEKNFGVEILKKHYKVVEVSGDDRREGTWYHISYAEPKTLKEAFSSNINLDKVVMNVANLLDDSKLGDNWIEVFPTADAYPIGNGEYGIRLEITGADESARKAYFRTKNGRVEVAFVNGSEAMCDDEREIARFIAGEYGLNLNESKSTNEDFNKYRDEEGHLLADKWYASVYPDDEVGIEQLSGLTMDDILKDRNLVGHCDTQVRDRVYKQLDKYSPMIRESKCIEEANARIKINPNSKMKEIEIEDESEVGSVGHPIAKLSDYSAGKLGESKSSKEDSESETILTICPNCQGDRFNDETGLCVDCGYDEKAHGEMDESMDEGFNDYIYLFPELIDDDIKMLAGYNLKYLGMNHGTDGSEDNWVVYGAKEDIEKYAEKYLGYELHPDYLYEYDDFAGEIV